MSKHAEVPTQVNEDLEEFLRKDTDLIKKNSIYNFKSKRLERILEKLAVGHSVFELSEGYYTGDEAWGITNMAYAFAPMLSQTEIDDIDAVIEISNQPLPEVGSRIYNHIYVIQGITNNENTSLEFMMLDWIDIQEGKYRYICANLINEIVVKIVIDEFLYAVITFSKEETI